MSCCKNNYGWFETEKKCRGLKILFGCSGFAPGPNTWAFNDRALITGCPFSDLQVEGCCHSLNTLPIIFLALIQHKESILKEENSLCVLHSNSQGHPCSRDIGVTDANVSCSTNRQYIYLILSPPCCPVSDHCYDICTVGAFTAYAQKFRQGGLRRMLRQLRDNVPDTEDGGNHMERLNAVLNSMNQLRSSVHLYCDSVCRAALQADAADLHNAVGVLADKVRTGLLYWWFFKIIQIYWK